MILKDANTGSNGILVDFHPPHYPVSQGPCLSSSARLLVKTQSKQHQTAAKVLDCVREYLGTMTNEIHQESATMAFEVLKSAILDGSAARLGRLAIAGRQSLETPNFFAVTSRGAVPHITPDNASKHLQIGGAYMALEDCRFYSEYRFQLARISD